MNVYIDTSALLKLLKREAETNALRTWLTDVRPRLLSSMLLQTEMHRAGLAYGLPRAVVQAVLEQVDIIAVTEEVLERAGRMPAAPERVLGALDAIHLVSAEFAAFETVLTYDRQMSEAASFHGFTVLAPR